MNYYQEELNSQMASMARLARRANHEASLNTLDTARRLFRDMERNGEFNYDNVVTVLERLEELHMKEMER